MLASVCRRRMAALEQTPGIMRDVALGCLAGIWIADGIAILIAPRYVVARVRDAVRDNPSIFRWEILSIAAGVALILFGSDLLYQPLWTLSGIGMVFKGAFLWLAPAEMRDPFLGWCLNRDDIDYRFWGLGLCTLAVLLLHALGWIARP